MFSTALKWRLGQFFLFLFSHRCLAIARWMFTFFESSLERITLQRRRIRDFLSNRQSPLFLNLGSGPRGVDDARWVNVDGFRDQSVHYLVDFGRPLPFPRESFEVSSANM
jgi:hypothetical protein